MIKTLKVLSLLLDYPTKDLREAVPDLRQALDEEALLPKSARRSIEALLEELTSLDIYELQERYVLLFDRTKSQSLHLFEHVHGEGRDRGQAMVDLLGLYDETGYELTTKQLPDYLPAFLEFLSMLPMKDAIEHLGRPAHIYKALSKRLDEKCKSYADVLKAVETLSGTTPDEATVQGILSAPEDDPNDLEAIDAVWEEAAVVFGPQSAPDQDAGCPVAGDMLARMMDPEPGKAGDR